MKWTCYINRQVIQGSEYVGVETSKEVLDLPNTTKVDMAFACQEASKAFKVRGQNILCLPTCTHDCTKTAHSSECDKRCQPAEPIFTEK